MSKRKGKTQLNFYIKDEKVTQMDELVKEKKTHTRTNLLVKCLAAISETPDILTEGYVKKLQFDRELLFELIKLFDKIPCQFEFDARSHEIQRIQEIQEELGING